MSIGSKSLYIIVVVKSSDLVVEVSGFKETLAIFQ